MSTNNEPKYNLYIEIDSKIYALTHITDYAHQNNTTRNAINKRIRAGQFKDNTLYVKAGKYFKSNVSKEIVDKLKK
jgi:hypothetical protein